MKDQLTSFKLSLRLKELGVKQDAYYSHYLNAGNDTGAVVETHVYDDAGEDFINNKLVSAFSVAELGEKLMSRGIDVVTYLDAGATIKGKKRFIAEEFPKSINNEHYSGRNEANARAKMLIHILEH